MLEVGSVVAARARTRAPPPRASCRGCRRCAAPAPCCFSTGGRRSGRNGARAAPIVPASRPPRARSIRRRSTGARSSPRATRGFTRSISIEEPPDAVQDHVLPEEEGAPRCRRRQRKAATASEPDRLVELGGVDRVEGGRRTLGERDAPGQVRRAARSRRRRGSSRPGRGPGRPPRRRRPPPCRGGSRCRGAGSRARRPRAPPIRPPYQVSPTREKNRLATRARRSAGPRRWCSRASTRATPPTMQ